MEIEINGRRGLLSADPTATLGSVLDHLRRHLAQNGQIPSEVVLDGELLSGAREEELAAQQASQFTLLQVTAVTAEQLLRNVLKGLAEAGGQLAQRSTSIGALLQVNKRQQALEELEGFLNDLATFAEGVHQCLRFVTSHGMEAPSSVDTDVTSLREVLERLREVLEEEQQVECADTLMYEVPQVLASWEKILREMIQSLKEHERPHETEPAGGN